MNLLRNFSNFILYGVVFAAVSAIVSLLNAGDFSLQPNEVSADITTSCADPNCSTGDGCGDCDGCAGGGGSCDAF